MKKAVIIILVGMLIFSCKKEETIERKSPKSSSVIKGWEKC